MHIIIEQHSTGPVSSNSVRGTGKHPCSPPLSHQRTEPGFWGLENGKVGEMEKNGEEWGIMNISRWTMQEQLPEWEKNGGGDWRKRGENGGN